jgi:murein L,D-transpeptidase YafK
MRIRRQFLTIPALLAALASPFLAQATLRANSQVDRIMIFKQRRELQLWSHGKLLKTYKIALGPHPDGQKEREGDGRTPEGIYTISGRNPKSAYHLSLRISYPNPEERARATKLHVSAGGDIMIHGLTNGYGWVGQGHMLHDWTAGCIAVTNHEIEEIYRSVPDQTVVEIRP